MNSAGSEFKSGRWWAATGSNRRPLACQASALPAELAALPLAALTLQAGRTGRVSRLLILASNAPSHRPKAGHHCDRLLRPLAGWRRNLAALWFAQFTAIFGFSFAFPFLPVYLRQLGVHDPGQLALWTGVTAGASGASLAIMSPIWGTLADRYGRRAMLLRAMIGGAVTVGLMGFARGPVDLLVLRLLQGATAGTVAAATALVASGTPRARVGWALGVLTSAVAVGTAFGPLLGGLAATLLGVRAIFWAGGALLGAATIPVFAVVREIRTGPADAAR